jgi:hypothetical protein
MRDKRAKKSPPMIENPYSVEPMEMEVAQESKTINPDRFEASSLNAIPNPKHFSYKVLGILSWAVLIFCFVSLGIAPRLMLNVARVVAIYMMVRLIAFMFLYLTGLAKIRGTEKRASASPYQGLSTREIARHKAVHHVVVLPNFNEPQDILSRTLQSLSVQEGARHYISVVLGMEEREPEARDKAEALLAQYKGKFYCLMATFHPSNLPGEAPGKGMNETWAARCAR